MPSEFELIRRYFSRPAPSALLGVGDDCALVDTAPEMVMAITTDMLLEGRHFHAGTDARALGHKSLAVNLSDLAAMGADPRWALLSIAVPDADQAWLEAFAGGFHAIARRFGVDLIGGDTTRGPRTISVTAMGEVPPQLALRRDGALAGDDIWLSGSTGDAALALAHIQGRVSLLGIDRDHCLARLNAPEPRVELGGRLRGIAHSAIDVSDGLIADLCHILESSGVGADVWYESLPRSPALAAAAARGDLALADACLVGGGDDYELVFTVPRFRRGEVETLAAELRLALTRIGMVVPGTAKVALRDANGAIVPVVVPGFDHFG